MIIVIRKNLVFQKATNLEFLKIIKCQLFQIYMYIYIYSSLRNQALENIGFYSFLCIDV